MAHLDELDSRGYRCYFQFTILGYPRELDPIRKPRSELRVAVGLARAARVSSGVAFQRLTKAAAMIDRYASAARG
jgi:hypothetical protein